MIIQSSFSISEASHTATILTDLSSKSGLPFKVIDGCFGDHRSNKARGAFLLAKFSTDNSPLSKVAYTYISTLFMSCLSSEIEKRPGPFS